MVKGVEDGIDHIALEAHAALPKARHFLGIDRNVFQGVAAIGDVMHIRQDSVQLRQLAGVLKVGEGGRLAGAHRSHRSRASQEEY